jgi:DNA (cytosine-5)-methyltransferase 1
MSSNISVVDLFCGAGGLTHGLEKVGLTVEVGYDIDPVCQFPYEQNNKSKFLLKEVENINSIELQGHFAPKGTRVLVGCAPCQPFSSYSRRYRDQESKWHLLRDFARLIKECNPEIVSMENVIQLKHHAVYKEFIETLEYLNYYVQTYEVNCLDYGIPQSRQRLVLLASKLSNIALIAPTHNLENYKTVRETIGHLEPLAAGQASKMDRLHQCSKLSELNLQRIRASKPGGTWRDWPPELIAKCHAKNTGKTYPSVYGRMEWNKPSPTITTQCFGFGNGRFGHPEQDRAISLREAALLQTFPENYEFLASNGLGLFTSIGRLIGNAVPVKLGEIIGQSILRHIEKLN